MAIWGVGLDEAERVKNDIEKIFEILKSNHEALDEISKGGNYYKHLKEYFRNWMRFVHTSSELPPETPFYRVRHLNTENQNGVDNISGLKYAPKGTKFGRMSNHSLNVMYTSYHEYTAISESRLEEGNWFQLTRFKSKNRSNVSNLACFLNYILQPHETLSFLKIRLRNYLAFQMAWIQQFEASPLLSRH